jgi:hypothetical protein
LSTGLSRFVRAHRHTHIRSDPNLPGVPRILEDTLPDHFSLKLDGEGFSSWTPYESYMRTTRININVRQVFPKGFDQVEN